MKIFSTITATAFLLGSSAALAQTTTETPTPAPAATRAQDRLNAILGTLFGNRAGSTETIEAQWAAGRTPLATQRVQFETRIDSDVRAGSLTRTTGDQLKVDYAALVQLEARYGADRRFTTQERDDLADRYGALTQVLAEGAYPGTGGTTAGGTPATTTAEVAAGQAEFGRRVDAQLAARRISRTEATRLRTDYAAVVRVERDYLVDGSLSTREREDLDARLDALDTRVGDVAYQGGSTYVTPRTRLDAIARAMTSTALTAAVRAQLRVEHEDVSRLEQAYAQLTPSADDRAYLERRIVDLETRARVRR